MLFITLETFIECPRGF